MTHPDEAPQSNLVERKVTASAAATYLGSLALLALLDGVADTNLVTELPDWIEVILAPLIPSLVSFLGGYAARHTPRPDLPVERGRHAQAPPWGSRGL